MTLVALCTLNTAFHGELRLFCVTFCSHRAEKYVFTLSLSTVNDACSARLFAVTVRGKLHVTAVLVFVRGLGVLPLRLLLVATLF